MLYDTSSLIFLSTLSLRRATRRSVKLFRQNYISIHALLAESDINRVKRLLPSWISIHALLAESDHDSYVIMEATKVISIHALLAESDKSTPAKPFSTSISIHALLAESDNVKVRMICTSNNFYPRSPCGERR